MPEVTLTKDEAYAIADLIDCNLFSIIRNDTDIDSMKWLRNVINVYVKCSLASGYESATDNLGKLDAGLIMGGNHE